MSRHPPPDRVVRLLPGCVGLVLGFRELLLQEFLGESVEDLLGLGLGGALALIEDVGQSVDLLTLDIQLIPPLVAAVGGVGGAVRLLDLRRVIDGVLGVVIGDHAAREGVWNEPPDGLVEVVPQLTERHHRGLRGEHGLEGVAGV